jgi:transcription antitermination factor NusG
MKRWLVFYTKSRQEKKVSELLRRRGFEVYLPLQKVVRQWSDRKKKVEVPLFNSYIFVNEEEHRIKDVLQIPGVAWNIRHNDKPAVLHPKELETIKRFIESGLLIEVSGIPELRAGDAVEVVDGPLKGLTGHFMRTSAGQRFVVSFEAIGNSVMVEIRPEFLRKSDTPPLVVGESGFWEI